MVLSKSSYECSLAGETHPRHLVIAECSGGCPPGKQRESEHVHCRVTIEFRLSVLANILATVGEPLFATTLQPPANYPATTVQLTPLAGPSFSEPSHNRRRTRHRLRRPMRAQARLGRCGPAPTRSSLSLRSPASYTSRAALALRDVVQRRRVTATSPSLVSHRGRSPQPALARAAHQCMARPTAPSTLTLLLPLYLCTESAPRGQRLFHPNLLPPLRDHSTSSTARRTTI